MIHKLVNKSYISSINFNLVECVDIEKVDEFLDYLVYSSDFINRYQDNKFRFYGYEDPAIKDLRIENKYDNSIIKIILRKFDKGLEIEYMSFIELTDINVEFSHLINEYINKFNRLSKINTIKNI